MTGRSDARLGVLLALLSALLWGVSGAVAAGAFDEVSPARVAETRALLAVVVLVPFAWWRGLLAPGDRVWWLMVLGVNLAVVNVTFYWAIDRLGVGPGATIQFLGPVLVLVWMVMVQHRVVNRAAWGAAIAAVLGVAMVTEAWQLEGSDWLGVAAGFAAAATFASYLLLGEYLARDLAPVTVVAWGFLFALVFWLIVQPLWTFPTDLSGDVWAALLWVGIIGTVIPFISELAALARVASGIVGVIATTEPVFGAIAAWFLLEQELSGLQIVGALTVVAAVASIQRWGIPETEVPLEAAR